MSRAALLALALSAFGTAQAAPAPEAHSACTIVFGQGRNVADDDARANASWNDVNRAFNNQVAIELAAAGHLVVPLLAPVEVTDRATIITTLIQRADRDACGVIVETTIFANDQEHLLVVRLRAYPVLRGTTRIGDPVYTDQQEFQLTQRTLERLAPSALGKSMAANYLHRQPR